MSYPLVSVIMVVRNGERFLQDAINSVIAQNYQPLEIILVDGQSTDKTAQIAQSYPEIQYIYQSDLGTANAYNLGIETAKGDFIAFLSHDDLWTPDKLKIQIDYMIAHPHILYTIGRVKFFLEPGCEFPKSLREDILIGDRPLRIMEVLVARKEAFIIVGKLDPAYSPADDVDWFSRAQDLRIPMSVLDHVLLLKRVHDKNTSVNSKINLDQVFRVLKRSSERKKLNPRGTGMQNED